MLNHLIFAFSIIVWFTMENNNNKKMVLNTVWDQVMTTLHSGQCNALKWYIGYIGWFRSLSFLKIIKHLRHDYLCGLFKNAIYHALHIFHTKEQFSKLLRKKSRLSSWRARTSYLFKMCTNYSVTMEWNENNLKDKIMFFEGKFSHIFPVFSQTFLIQTNPLLNFTWTQIL